MLNYISSLSRLSKKKKLFLIFLSLLALIGTGLWLFIIFSSSAGVHATFYSQILTTALILAVSLLLIVFIQLYFLWRDYRLRIFGARIKFRLMLMFGTISIIPGLIVYLVSVQFVTSSIESWFNIPLETGLEASLNISRSGLENRSLATAFKIQLLLEQPKAQLTHIGKKINLIDLITAQDQKQNAEGLQIIVNNLRLHYAVLLHGKEIIASSLSSLPENYLPNYENNFNQLLEEKGDLLLLHSQFNLPESNLSIRVVEILPDELKNAANSVNKTYRSYQQLSISRQGLTRLYALGLTVTIFMVLAGALAMALSFSRRLAAPLYVLAEGTRAVAHGDFTPREVVSGKDELGLLTHSFNQMTKQLDEARQEKEKHRQQLESAHGYLESILANISTGVMVFDQHYYLRTINDAAVTILQAPVVKLLHQQPDNWLSYPEIAELIGRHFASGSTEWLEQISITNENGLIQTLMVRASTLPAGFPDHSAGYIVVFDDISEVVKMQRSAAWGEVARRLAHEIKNPLTPIQLSAERLHYRLADKLQGDELKLLTRSTQTIINQVQAMKEMVDEFRDYARLPTPQLIALNLNQLLLEVINLYDNSQLNIQQQLQEIPEVLGDASLLRQVIHNLLTNAAEALVNTQNGKIFIETMLENYHVNLKISDNGCGFDDTSRNNAFEPYFTTKEKGTGLGLAIVKKIVDEHQGQIMIVRGNPPYNTCVCLRLRLANGE